MEGGSFTGDFEKKVILCFIRRPVSPPRALRDVKKMALEMGISLHTGHTGNLEARFIYQRLQERVKEGSGNEVSLFMGAL